MIYFAILLRTLKNIAKNFKITKEKKKENKKAFLSSTLQSAAQLYRVLLYSINIYKINNIFLFQ